MAEELTLTTPAIAPARSTTSYKVARLDLRIEHQQFFFAVRGTQGERIEAFREGPEAVTLMRQLNKANGQVKSLERRAFEWLLTQPEGAELQGTITGVPD